jgi:hypothetical protein
MALDMWTLCANPADFPGKFTARRHTVDEDKSQPTAELLVADDIEVLRRELAERGFVCVGRHAGDDPVIVESWL